MRRFILILGILTAFVNAALDANASLVYSNDFESAVGPEWSNTSIDITLVGGRRFLGQFGADTINLTLDNLPKHSDIMVTFDLFILLTWDGNNMDLGVGPDIWTLSVDSGSVLFNTTFSNAFASDTDFRQAYPDAYPGGDNPGLTGAAETGTLGYPHLAGYAGVGDSVYHLSFTFPHSDSILGLEFTSSALSEGGLTDESWGIDNIQVDVRAVPLPSTFALFGIGFVGIVICQKRLKNWSLFSKNLI